VPVKKKPEPADPAPPPPNPDKVQPPVQQAEPIDLPCTPEQVIHNVMVRQLADDLKNPPKDDPDIPALVLLAKLQNFRDTGQSVAPLQDEIASVTQGVDIETKITLMAYASVLNRRLMGTMRAGLALDKLFNRMCQRGDLRPHEAIILKKLQLHEQEVLALALQRLAEANLALSENAAAAMDYTPPSLSKANPNLAKMTPQGREIYRKIVVRARRRIYGEGNGK
jgi:hypothetical protein